jgi:hypothetical protein
MMAQEQKSGSLVSRRSRTMNPSITPVDDGVPGSAIEGESRDSLIVAENTTAWAGWAAAAQAAYGFDLPTARRLAFARWLHETGRLTDG